MFDSTVQESARWKRKPHCYHSLPCSTGRENTDRHPGRDARSSLRQAYEGVHEDAHDSREFQRECHDIVDMPDPAGNHQQTIDPQGDAGAVRQT